MKLCIVTHSFAKGSGQGRVNYEIVKEAVRQGHAITLVSSDIASEISSFSQINWIPIHIDNWPTELVRNVAFSVQASRWIRQNRDKFDLIKVNGAIASVDADINAVHFVHSAWLHSPAHTWKVRRDLYGAYQWLYTAINAYWEKEAFKRSRCLVAVSKQIANELTDIGVPHKDIQIILNGVDLEEFSPGAVDRDLLGLPIGVPLALFAGDIQTSRKNLDTVLLALSQVPHLHLAVAGRTEGSPYPRMAEKLGVSERTHFLGYRRDIPELMKAVNFFVFPSRYEPWGLALIEAMASGLPVITAATAGGSEQVTPESGVVLEDPNDAHALSKAMLNMVSDEKHRKRMGKLARISVEQHSWQNMAKKYVRLFEEIANMP